MVTSYQKTFSGVFFTAEIKNLPYFYFWFTQPNDLTRITCSGLICPTTELYLAIQLFSCKYVTIKSS